MVTMNTKGKRIKKIRETINKEWPQYFFKFIKDNPIQDWNWSWLSGNPNITIEIIKENPMQNWDWNNISKNTNITIEIITS